jgi:hypothetical protein
VPRPDPIPDRERTSQAWLRYKALMSWMALAAIVAVLLALLYLWMSGVNFTIHMAIATAAGVGLSVLLGTALMGLIYFSSHSGHDEGAHESSSFVGTRDEEASTSDEYRD